MEPEEREILKAHLRSSVLKHFGFCLKGDFLANSLADCETNLLTAFLRGDVSSVKASGLSSVFGQRHKEAHLGPKHHSISCLSVRTCVGSYLVNI